MKNAATNPKSEIWTLIGKCLAELGTWAGQMEEEADRGRARFLLHFIRQHFKAPVNGSYSVDLLNYPHGCGPVEIRVLYEFTRRIETSRAPVFILTPFDFDFYGFETECLQSPHCNSITCYAIP